MFTFIHAADIHLDSPLRGLEFYEGAPVDAIRGATREALINMVDLAIMEKVNFLLIAGDLYDGDWKDYNTGLFFAKEMSRLREAGIGVYIAFGNHDAASRITKRLENMPSNVHHFSNKKPTTEIIEDFGVAIHGQSFPKRAVTEDISAAYPLAKQGYFNIGILHTSLTGHAGHESYAPCTIDGLVSKNYDYWALGHIHKRAIISEAPWIIFPGNIQGRNIKETGGKGCTLVTVEDQGDIFVEHRNLDVMRWEICNVDASNAESPEVIIKRLKSESKKIVDNNDGRPMALRVIISGRCVAHKELATDLEKWTNEIRAAATDENAGMVWIEKIKLNTSPPVDFKKMAKQNDPIGDLLRFINKLDSSPAGEKQADCDFLEIMKFFEDDFIKLKSKLPGDIDRDGALLDLRKPETLHEILKDARQELVIRLLDRGQV